MSTYLWDPFAAFGRLDREFDEIVRRGWGGRDRSRMVRVGFVPPADVITEGDDVVVCLELPGVDVERDVTVELERGRLVVHGERTETHRDDGHGVVLRERRHGAFHREFSLPDGVGADQISATYDNGVLSVRLGGAMAATRSTRIPVAPGTSAVLEGSPAASPDGAAADGSRAAEGKRAR